MNFASPPIVYVPCLLDEDGRGTRIRLAQLDDGRTALAAYSALDRFLDACGNEHPWALFAYEGLAQLQAETGFELSLLDPELPSAFRMDGPSDG